jgi:carbamate kinase
VSTDITRPDAPMIERATTTEMRPYSFAAGSMGPKVDAACRFVERTGHTAAIGSLEHAVELLAGTRGTTVIASHEHPASK